MRVLLDESVPRDLGFALVGHFVRTVQTMGWAGFSNGKLLTVMLTENFETLVTRDQNLEKQPLCFTLDELPIFGSTFPSEILATATNAKKLP